MAIRSIDHSCHFNDAPGSPETRLDVTLHGLSRWAGYLALLAVLAILAHLLVG